MLRRTVLDVLLVLAYVLAVWLLFQIATRFWFPVAGLRFVLLLFVPRRLFVPIALAEPLAFRAVALLWGEAHGVSQPPPFPVELLKFAAAATGPLLLRRYRTVEQTGPKALIAVMGAMLLSAMLASLCSLQYPFAKRMALPANVQFLQLTLGDYIGMLVVVPLAMMLVQPIRRPQPRHWRLWLFDLPLLLLPALLAGVLLLLRADNYQTYFIASGLCLIPAIWMAFRGGWRGAAVSFAAISTLIAMTSWMNGQVLYALESQLYLATSGSIGLIMGAAVDVMRDSRRRLREHVAMLQHSHARMEELATQLRETARRNLTLSEDLRRWITSELHDEIGQNLSALQVRMKVGETLLRQGPLGVTERAKSQFFEPVQEIIVHMRGTVSGLLRDLRPAGLDEFGLNQALRDGAIRHLVETAGLDYRLYVNGPTELLDRLDNDAQTALYRIVQEAATNTLRHADASRFHVHLMLRAAPGSCRVALRCADDGVGFRPERRSGIGLHGIHDRVLSFDGRMRVHSDCNGTRLLVTMGFPIE